ncbi:MAG: histidinol-phosphate transaminase [Rhizobiaceae bacterium]
MAAEQLTAKEALRPAPVIEALPVRARISRPQPKGLPVINLSFNEMPFGPSTKVENAIADAAANANRYGEPSCRELRQALGEQNGLDPERIICGNGSEELLDVIGRVFARPGDEILIPQYGYIQFPIVANRVGATLVRAAERDYTTDVDAILAAVTVRTKIVFLANPNNPTGTMVDEAELDRLADRLSPSVVLVIDLAYGEFAGPGYCDRVQALMADRDNVITTRTFSKAYGLAGLRAGWCHAPEWMMPALYAGRGMGTVNALAQAAALAALKDSEAVERNVAEIVSERDRVAGELSSLGVETLPSRANFLLAKLPGKADPEKTEALVEHLFDEAGILVNRTREAGLEKFFRFSLSLREHNDLLIEQVARFIG